MMETKNNLGTDKNNGGPGLFFAFALVAGISVGLTKSLDEGTIGSIAAYNSAKYGYSGSLQFLEHLGVDLENWAQSSLRVASDRGHADVVEFLLERYEFTTDVEDRYLHRAVHSGNRETVEAFINHGVDPHRHYGEALFIALFRRDQAITELLLDQSVEITHSMFQHHICPDPAAYQFLADLTELDIESECEAPGL